MTCPKAKPIAEYAIGDELFRYVAFGGVFRFAVDGRRENADGVMLEAECQTCAHGWKCRVLLAQNDYGRIEHVHMLNEREDDSQRHWHTNDGLHFWPSAELAKAEQIKRLARQAEEEVRRLTDALDAAKKKAAEFKDLVEAAP